MLELDHLFCMIADPESAVARVERAGWVLDAGQIHPGQGTANRRLPWPEQYLELLWIADRSEARGSPLRLDHRADWRTTNASPFGFAFRGRLDDVERETYWLYDALGITIWIHRDNDGAPERPLVFVLETPDDAFEQRRPRTRAPALVARQRPGELRAVRLTGPAGVDLPAYQGPIIEYAPGPHRLELVVGDGASHEITEILSIRG